MEMEMEMEMDSLSFYTHLHQNPPPSSGGQEAFSSYCCLHPSCASMVDSNRREVDPTAPPPSRPRSAPARKDRHSKICTAGGMRDRRMRLSLVVARRFFSLQDKLGFDKASKTVQWLLDMSTVGISHLLAASTTSKSMSEEDGSGSVLLDSSDHVMVADAETNTCKKQQVTKGRRRAGRKSSNNGAPALLPDKESRARARQRARERTMERNCIRSSVSTVAVKEAPAPVPEPTRQVILPVTPTNFGSYCEDQEPWELGGVVFAKAKPRQHR